MFLPGWIISALGVIFAFGLVIFIHEFGHFITAKYCDTEVEAFAIGMGPALLTYQYGETEYRICALPLGGYVKMAGEEPDEMEEEEDNPRAFFNKSVWERTLILVAGGTFNILLGYVLYAPYGMFYGEHENPSKVGYVSKTVVKVEESGDTETVKAPARGKLQVGDRIVSVNGHFVDSFKDVRIRNELLGDQERHYDVVRNGETITVTVDPVRTVRERTQTPSYIVGILPYVKPTIGKLSPEGVAKKKLGLQTGDQITKVGDTTVQSWLQFQFVLRDSAGTVPITFARSDKLFTHKVQVPADDKKLAQWIGKMGWAPELDRRYYGFFESWVYAGQRVVRDITLVYKALVGLLTQRLSPYTMSGPVGIIDITGQMASMGIWPLIRFSAFISINLGLINLLPVPVLDGGHILLSIPEMFTGKRLPSKVIGAANKVGLALLLTLLVFVTYVDLSRLSFFKSIVELF